MRKIENFVKSKCYPEDISKGKGKRANVRKSCKNFKIFDGYVTYKGKERMVFDNDRKLLIPQHNTILPQLNAYLEQSKLLKCVNIAITYSFLFTKKFRESLFPKGVFISLEERTLASIYRSSHQKCSIKKGVLRNFTTFTGKHLSQSLLFNKVAGLGTPFLQITSGLCFCIYLLGNYDWGVDISL